MNISFNRVILFVQDVTQLKKNYCQNFGFEVLEEEDGWAVLKAGNCEIALHRAGAMHRGNDRAHAGSNNNVKLVFEITTDLHQLREKLIKNNVAMQQIVSFEGSPNLYCDGADIEGNVFQLMQRVV